MRQNGVRSNVRFPYGKGMKKGGRAMKSKGGRVTGAAKRVLVEH